MPWTVLGLSYRARTALELAADLAAVRERLCVDAHPQAEDLLGRSAVRRSCVGRPGPRTVAVYTTAEAVVVQQHQDATAVGSPRAAAAR